MSVLMTEIFLLLWDVIVRVTATYVVMKRSSWVTEFTKIYEYFLSNLRNLV